MSDIQLYTFRSSRNRNGYAPLDTTNQPRPRESSSNTTNTTPHVSGSGSGSPMPLRAVTVAAAASFSFTSARRKKGRRRDEYSDGEPEEEARLLGEGERDPGCLHDDADRPANPVRAHNVTLQVRPRISTLSSFGPTKLSSAIDVTERFQGQITDCTLTTTRCVDICVRIF